MRLPFTVDQFFDVFRRYNEAVWPAQFLLYGLACVVIVLAARGKPQDRRVISAILAALWLWMAIAYHLTFFAAINRVAILFGVLFVVQAVVIAVFGVAKGRLTFRARWDLAGVTGALLMIYALVAYPLLGAALGHDFPASPTFGLPCPTTIFTFGVLLWARPVLPRVLLIVPLLWAAVGTTAALALGVREDLGLMVAGALSALLLLRKGRGADAEVLHQGMTNQFARARL